MEKNLQAPQVLLSAAHIMKSPVLPVLKVELARFCEVLGLCNMASNIKSSLFSSLLCKRSLNMQPQPLISPSSQVQMLDFFFHQPHTPAFQLCT
jgi:hypothetical protein